MEALAHAQFAELEGRHWWFRARRRVCMGLLRSGLGARRPRRALDIGSGSGGMLEELAEVCDELVSAELDRDALRRSRERGRGAGVQCRADALPWQAGGFELVTLFDVLEHVAEEGAALAEIRHVLAPGGTLFLHVPAHPWLYAQNDRRAGHHRRYTRRGLCRTLAAAGLEVERATFTNVLLFPLIAPTVLALKLGERLGLDGEYTNLSWSRPPLGERCLEALFAAELALSRRRDLPLGHSLAVVARKPRSVLR